MVFEFGMKGRVDFPCNLRLFVNAYHIWQVLPKTPSSRNKHERNSKESRVTFNAKRKQRNVWMGDFTNKCSNIIST